MGQGDDDRPAQWQDQAGFRPLSHRLAPRGKILADHPQHCILKARRWPETYSFSVSSGTILNRSPTRPTSATWKIGASSSLLIAMIVLLSFIPARCWMAPEMPIAI